MAAAGNLKAAEVSSPEFLVAWSNLVASVAAMVDAAADDAFVIERDHPYADEAAFGGLCPVEQGTHVLVSDHEYEDVPTLASVTAVAPHVDAPGGWLVKLHYAGCAYECAQWVPVTKLAPPCAAERAVRHALLTAIEAVTVNHMPGEAVTLKGGAFGRYSERGGRAERPRADLHCLVVDVAIRRGGCGLPFECWYRCECSDGSMEASARALSLGDTYRPPSATDASYDVRGEKIAGKGYVLQWYMAVEVSEFGGSPAAVAAAEERNANKKVEADRLAGETQKAADAAADAEQAESKAPSSSSGAPVDAAKARADAEAAADAATAAAAAARGVVLPVSIDSKRLFADSSLSKVLSAGGSFRVTLESYYDVYDHRAAALPIGCVDNDGGVAVTLLSAVSAGPALRVACTTLAESKRADREARRALMSKRQRMLHSMRWIACLAIAGLSFVAGPGRRAIVEPDDGKDVDGGMGEPQPAAQPQQPSPSAGAEDASEAIQEPPPPSESSNAASAIAAAGTSPAVVIVREGDTLWGIATAYCDAGSDIRAAVSRLRESGGGSGGIQPGDRITFPEGACPRRA